MNNNYLSWFARTFHVFWYWETMDNPAGGVMIMQKQSPEIFYNTYFEEHLWTATSNFGNLTVFRKNVLYWVEEINYSQYGKQPILSKCKINILSRTIHLFSGYQLSSFLLTLYLSLTQFRALIDVL